MNDAYVILLGLFIGGLLGMFLFLVLPEMISDYFYEKKSKEHHISQINCEQIPDSFDIECNLSNK